jgi:membrane protein implicated in regulation of membrane protease activity
MTQWEYDTHQAIEATENAFYLIAFGMTILGVVVGVLLDESVAAAFVFACLGFCLSFVVYTVCVAIWVERRDQKRPK